MHGKGLSDSWSHVKFSFFHRRKQKTICKENLAVYQMLPRVFFLACNPLIPSFFSFCFKKRWFHKTFYIKMNFTCTFMHFHANQLCFHNERLTQASIHFEVRARGTCRWKSVEGYFFWFVHHFHFIKKYIVHVLWDNNNCQIFYNFHDQNCYSMSSDCIDISLR